MLIRSLWEISGAFPKRNQVGDFEGEALGLINFLLRRPLTEDPLAMAKPIEGKVLEAYDRETDGVRS